MENKISRASTSNIDVQKNEQPRNYNLLVYIRIRPVLKLEFGKEVVVSCENDGKSIIIDNKSAVVQSIYDRVFDQKSSQFEVFDQIRDFIPAVIEGYNCTVFAYGQTGSGKTHTMFGSDWEQLVCEMQVNRTNMQTTYVDNVKEDKYFSGLIPRMIFDIFREIDSQDKKGEGSYAVYCCFLQIYNEKVYDLLQDKFGTNALDIRENKIDGIYVEGLTEYLVNNYKECITLMQRGERNRFIRSTSSNVKSSRSHTIFQIIVETTRADKKGRLQKAKLNLCDLAGSEKIKKSEVLQGAHLTELKNINLSLTTLGKVIHSLSQTGKRGTIPYRESKLTRLLQDSLGGNTRTCLIATVSPILDCVDETCNTLKFAERAQHVITMVRQNKINAIDQDLVAKLQNEIKYLKDILNMRRKGSSVNEVHHKLLLLQEENDRLRKAISVPEVEGLIEENRKMKMELQALRNSTQVNHLIDEEVNDQAISSKLPDFGFDGDQKENNEYGIGGLDDSRYNIRKGYSSTDSRQKSNSTTVDKLNTSDLNNKPRSSATTTSVAASQRLLNLNSLSGLSGDTTSKLLFQKGHSRKNTADDSATQVRVRGAKKGEEKFPLGKNPNLVQYMDTRRKEQNRALERLKELEHLQKRHQEKMKGFVLEERSQNPLILSTPNKNEAYSKNEIENSHSSKFDGQVNLKQVKKDVHEKYKNPTRLHLEEIKSKNKDTQQNRYRNIERNFVGVSSPINGIKN